MEQSEQNINIVTVHIL